MAKKKKKSLSKVDEKLKGIGRRVLTRVKSMKKSLSHAVTHSPIDLKLLGMNAAKKKKAAKSKRAH